MDGVVGTGQKDARRRQIRKTFVEACPGISCIDRTPDAGRARYYNFIGILR